MENNNTNTRKWLKSHHDTLFPFFPYLKKRRIEWLFDRLEQKGAEKGALYIHIPFCSGKCTFCILTKELPSHPSNTTKYVNSVLEEASAWSDYFSPVETVYIGGGTPTSLSSEALKLLFTGLREHFQIEPDAEISVETTVSELTEEKMNLLVELGVNRLSVGVQTFNRGLRKTLGRRGEGEEVIEKLNTVRAFFPLLSIDLLYDILGQGKTDVIADLQKAIEIGMDGISLYPLIYSPKTAIARQFVPPPIELIIAKNTIELTSESMFWANTIGAEMAVECLYNGKENLVSLEESTAKIAKAIMLNKLRLRLKSSKKELRIGLGLGTGIRR